MARSLTLPDAPFPLDDELAAGGAIAWRQPLTIATYATGEPEGLPVFSESRVYQGSSGRVYPLPFVERIERESAPRAWDAVHLENRWVRLVVLPELGGRIHVGYDKVAGYDFFYRNSVIKPALVGLAGPWISGGVEFNWPQHHRPATYLPTDVDIEHGDDGSVTVWCTDHDPFARMRASHGIRLRADSSRIELRVRLHNRTEDRQTFLWWANVAARSHERYQSFFPPDVHFVADHARRAVTAFPRADRPYYGIDYPARVDAQHPDADRLDIYSSIPAPTSYMVLATRDDFFGGYDHDAQAGFVHWADRRIAPGKKQWTWGSGPFGEAWDRQLTDDDGPYVELMAGVFTDNQPDFSFLAPGEVREFSQFWFPISRIGVPVHATTDAALALRVVGDELEIGVASTEAREQVRVVVRAGDGVVHEIVGRAGPDAPLLARRSIPRVALDALEVDVLDGARMIARWRPATDPASWLEPDVATEPALPQHIESNDELYLTGVHLEQYRHPTRDPEPYWREALRRDPADSRALIALAARAYRRGDYAAAERDLRAAIERQTRRNGHPADTEALYRLGLLLQRTGRDALARDAFGQAQWAQPWADAARIELARASLRRGDPAAALEHLEPVARDPRAAGLRVIALRRRGDLDRAGRELRDAIAADPRDRWLRAIAGAPAADEHDAGIALDVAGEYRRAGEAEDAQAWLARAAALPSSDAGSSRPIALYLSAALADERGRDDEAARWRAAARVSDPERCLPAGLDAHDALRAAIAADPRDALALDLLGIWLYDAGRHEEALEAWGAAAALGADRAVLQRNRALGLVTVRGDLDAAAELYDAAIAAEPARARLLAERDQLAARRDESDAARLERLDAHPRALAQRDDLVVARAALLVRLGRGEQAIAALTERQLGAWEGGEGLALAAWDAAHEGLAEQALARGDRAAAAEWARRALDVPVALGEGRHPLSSLARLHLLDGLASGDERALRAGVADPADPVAQPDRAADESTYWVGRCALALGDARRADVCWGALERRAEQLAVAADPIDYFATSLPELVLFGVDPRAHLRDAARLGALAEDGRRRSASVEAGAA